ncbi:MAG: V-type ATP synthase subunit E family protein [Tissierellia bacterium]|nr:V-type ATP synthase subunit E family protein [Tissierellia bacterium]
MANNIDNIVSKLKAEAGAEIDRIDSQAQEEVQAIRDKILGQAKKEEARILETGDYDARNAYNQIYDNVELRLRDQRLKESQDFIQKIFDLALEKMNKKSDEDFIEEIRQALEGLEEEKLAIRIPKDRLGALKEAGLDLTIDEENWVDSGFVLFNDRVNYNYKYEDILAENRDRIGPQLIDFMSR